MYTMYASASNNILSYTHIGSYIHGKKSPPPPPLDNEVSLWKSCGPKTKISHVFWNSYTNGSPMTI